MLCLAVGAKLRKFLSTSQTSIYCGRSFHRLELTSSGTKCEIFHFHRNLWALLLIVIRTAVMFIFFSFLNSYEWLRYQVGGIRTHMDREREVGLNMQRLNIVTFTDDRWRDWIWLFGCDQTQRTLCTYCGGINKTEVGWRSGAMLSPSFSCNHGTENVWINMGVKENPSHGFVIFPQIQIKYRTFLKETVW